MAGGYEEATEDIQALVASTLDQATQQDCAFVAGASQALANWTEKYQLAMSQGENQSLHDQLAHWDQVRQAGVTLSQKITSLTTEYEPGTTSSEIFQALLPDCFCRIHAWTEATFHELHATLPTLLCQFIAPDQAGQMLSAIFTCMSNYNTEICGMAMAQAVVPVYTIPNTYWVQQSLWEGICRIIPGIARTSRSGLHSFEPTAPHNTPVEQVATAPAAGSTGVSSSTRKNTAKEARQTGVPLGIPPAGSVWVTKEAFQQHIPTINLTDNDPAGAGPPKTSMPIKAAPEVDRSHSGKKLDISKIKGTHILFEMQDQWEKTREKESEGKDQVATSQRVAGKGPGSAGELPPGLPAKLPKFPERDVTSIKPSDPEVAVRVLMDCEGSAIACDHPEYGKEQNIGLHDVVSPTALARVTATETYIMDGIPTTVRVNNAYCPFCAYACSNYRAINNHVRMHFRAILVCGWPGCYYVQMQSKKMIEHSAEVHGMARARPP